VDFLSRVVRKDDRIVVPAFLVVFTTVTQLATSVRQREKSTVSTGVSEAHSYDALVQLRVEMPFRPVSRHHIVILLTDGNDRSSKAWLNDAIASVQASGIVIFAIDTRYVRRKRAGFEGEQRQAARSGGRCFEFVSDKELQDGFKTIQASIENQYFLTYAPTPEPHAQIERHPCSACS
jgi:hypothetical protein